MPAGPEPPAELTSWKQIAEYLGVNVRTAQKWEAKRALPVHRVAGERGRVRALPAELERWKTLTASSPRWWASPRFFKYYAAAATLAALFLAADRLARRRSGPPALFRIEHRTLFVTDTAHRPLWQHTFPEPLMPEGYIGWDKQQRVWFGDLDADSRVETLFVYYPVNAALAGTSLICFSEDGQPRWSFRPPAIADAERSYSRDYIISDLAVVDFGDGRGRSISITCRHIDYHPNHFAILDSRGAARGQYWHSGHLDYMAFADLNRDGVKEALLSGVNNGYQSATLVVLDPRDFSGCSGQGQGSPYQIQGVPLAREKAVLLFPRSCINRKFGLYNMGKTLRVGDGRIEVDVLEGMHETPERRRIIHVLDYDLNATAIVVSDDFRTAHQVLEASGELDHPLGAREIEGLRKVSVLKKR